MIIVKLDDSFVNALEQNLQNLKHADKLVDEIVKDKMEQIAMHNLMGGAIVMLQMINRECQKESR